MEPQSKWNARRTPLGLQRMRAERVSPDRDLPEACRPRRQDGTGAIPECRITRAIAHLERNDWDLPLAALAEMYGGNVGTWASALKKRGVYDLWDREHHWWRHLGHKVPIGTAKL